MSQTHSPRSEVSPWEGERENRGKERVGRGRKQWGRGVESWQERGCGWKRAGKMGELGISVRGARGV